MSKLYEHQSKYQKISVWENDGVRSLYLDDDLQFDDNNELDVHQAFLTPLIPYTNLNDKEVLIIGGGDGGMARTTRQWYPDAKITQCEIDEKVCEVSEKYFPQLNNDGQIFMEIDLHIGDGIDYINDMIVQDKQFDTVILDLTVGTMIPFRQLQRITDNVSFFISYKSIEQFDLNIFGLFEDYQAEVVNIRGYHNDSIIFCAGQFKTKSLYNQMKKLL